MVLDTSPLSSSPEASPCFSPVLWELPPSDPCRWLRPLSLSERVHAIASSVSSPSSSSRQEHAVLPSSLLPLFVSQSSVSSRRERNKDQRTSQSRIFSSSSLFPCGLPALSPSASSSFPSASSLYSSSSHSSASSSLSSSSVCSSFPCAFSASPASLSPSVSPLRAAAPDASEGMWAFEKLKREEDSASVNADEARLFARVTDPTVFRPFSRTNLLLTLQSARRGAILPPPSHPLQFLNESRGRPRDIDGGKDDRETRREIAMLRRDAGDAQRSPTNRRHTGDELSLRTQEGLAGQSGKWQQRRKQEGGRRADFQDPKEERRDGEVENQQAGWQVKIGELRDPQEQLLEDELGRGGSEGGACVVMTSIKKDERTEMTVGNSMQDDDSECESGDAESTARQRSLVPCHERVLTNPQGKPVESPNFPPCVHEPNTDPAGAAASEGSASLLHSDKVDPPVSRRSASVPPLSSSAAFTSQRYNVFVPPAFAPPPLFCSSSPYMEGLGSRGVRTGRAGGGWGRPRGAVGGLYQAGVDRFFRQQILHDDAFGRSFRARGHYGCVNAISFSTDGTILGSGGDDKRVLLWHVGEPRNLPFQEIQTKHQENIFGVVFDSSDQYVLTCGNDGLVTRVSMENPSDVVVRNDVDALRREASLPREVRLRLLRTMDAGASFQASFLFSQHQQAIVAMEAGTVETFDFRERDRLGRVVTRAGASVLSVCVHPVQQFLFAYCCCQKAALVDLRTNEAVCVLKDVLHYERHPSVPGGLPPSVSRLGARGRQSAAQDGRLQIASRTERGHERRFLSSSPSASSSANSSSSTSSSSNWSSSSSGTSSSERGRRRTRRSSPPARGHPRRRRSRNVASPSSPPSSPSLSASSLSSSSPTPSPSSSSASSSSVSSSSSSSSSSSPSPPRSVRSSHRTQKSSGSDAAGDETKKQQANSDGWSSDGEIRADNSSAQIPHAVPVKPSFLPSASDRGTRGARCRGALSEAVQEISHLPSRAADSRRKEGECRSVRPEFERSSEQERRECDSGASVSLGGEQDQRHDDAFQSALPLPAVASTSGPSTSCFVSPVLLSESYKPESDGGNEGSPPSPWSLSSFLSQEEENQRERREHLQSVTPTFISPLEDEAYVECEADADFSGDDFVCTTRGLSSKKTIRCERDESSVESVAEEAPEQTQTTLEGEAVAVASVEEEAQGFSPSQEGRRTALRPALTRFEYKRKHSRCEGEAGVERAEVPEGNVETRKRRKKKAEISPVVDCGQEEEDRSRSASLGMHSKNNVSGEPEDVAEVKGIGRAGDRMPFVGTDMEDEETIEQAAASARRSRLAARKGRRPLMEVTTKNEERPECTSTRGLADGPACGGDQAQGEMPTDLSNEKSEENQDAEKASDHCGDREAGGVEAALLPEVGRPESCAYFRSRESNKGAQEVATKPFVAVVLPQSSTKTEDGERALSNKLEVTASGPVSEEGARSKGYVSDPDELAGAVPIFDVGSENGTRERAAATWRRRPASFPNGGETQGETESHGDTRHSAGGSGSESRRTRSRRRREAAGEMTEEERSSEFKNERPKVPREERRSRGQGADFGSSEVEKGEPKTSREVRCRQERQRVDDCEGIPPKQSAPRLPATSRHREDRTKFSSVSEAKRQFHDMGESVAPGSRQIPPSENQNLSENETSSRSLLSAASSQVASRRRSASSSSSPRRSECSGFLSTPNTRRSPHSCLSRSPESEALVSSSERHDRVGAGQQTDVGDARGDPRDLCEERKTLDIHGRRTHRVEEGECEDSSDADTQCQGSSRASSQRSIDQLAAVSSGRETGQGEAAESDAASPQASSEALSDLDQSEVHRRRMRLRRRLLRLLQRRARETEALGDSFAGGRRRQMRGEGLKAKRADARLLRGSHRVHFSWSGKLMLLILTRKPPLVYATGGQFPLFELRSDGWWNLVTLKSGCFLFDDRHIAIGSEDKRVHVWRLPDVIDFEAHAVHRRTTILYSAYTLSGHLSIVNCCASTPPIGIGRASPVLATCGIERMIRLWTLGKQSDGISDDCLFYPPDDKYVTPESLENMDVISHFNRLAVLHRRRFGLGMDTDDSDEDEENVSEPSPLLGDSGDDDGEGQEDGEDDDAGQGSWHLSLRSSRRGADEQSGGDDGESVTPAESDHDVGVSGAQPSDSDTPQPSRHADSSPARQSRTRRLAADTDAQGEEVDTASGHANEEVYSSDDHRGRHRGGSSHTDSPADSDEHRRTRVERTEARRRRHELDACDVYRGSAGESFGADETTRGILGQRQGVSERWRRAAGSEGSRATPEHGGRSRRMRRRRSHGARNNEEQSSDSEPVGICIRYTVPRSNDFLV
uniref:WD domain, G-beta repeat-containing protein n=1 Tax=Toxoplasma gondii COUG TaxID=1074873 RepID=A0A2G8XV87_TOXGO|nr:WD domain, G-beta repeat-containing protein [Toxoplasma gondii COUG]